MDTIIKVIGYEEARTNFLKSEMEKAQHRIKFWQTKIKKAKNAIAEMEAHDNASNAGWEYNFYKDALEALEAGEDINVLTAQPKWISVEERLPEPNTTVLLIAHGWEPQLVYIGKLEKVESEKSWLTGLVSKASEWTVYGFSYLKEPIVTHWMPIPSTEGLE